MRNGFQAGAWILPGCRDHKLCHAGFLFINNLLDITAFGHTSILVFCGSFCRLARLAITFYFSDITFVMDQYNGEETRSPVVSSLFICFHRFKFCLYQFGPAFYLRSVCPGFCFFNVLLGAFTQFDQCSIVFFLKYFLGV